MVETEQQKEAMIALAIRASEQLCGSSKSLAELGEEYEDAERESSTFCAKLDELCFECTVCNNWFEQSEMSEDNDWICEGCEGDQDG